MVGYGAGLAALNLIAAAATPALAAEPITIAALGDSLTAGFGLPPGEGFVPQLQSWLDANGAEVVVLNAGVSGDTTAGGLSRTDWTLTPAVDAMIVELGANDVLRGLDPAVARANLDAILTKADAKGLPVLLVGIDVPPNYGADYKTQFTAIYPDLAAAHGAQVVPDFLGPLTAQADRAAALRDYVQPDGLHPNAKGVALIVEAIGPEVLKLIARVD